MRATIFYMAISAMLVTFNCPATTADRFAVLPREEITTTSAAAKTTSTPEPTSSDVPQSSSINSKASTSGQPASASSGSLTSSLAKATSGSAASAALSSAMSAAASSAAAVTASPISKGSLNVTTSNDTVIEGLPIQPQITPGLSVAGAFMLLTGSLYTIIGIKTQWIHVSASSAYLVSLAVTVLIIYVMHPPISEGLQGAYVAAAILSGAMLGGLSLLFKDITEGFATFLGGFCLSMWFLVLKPGGLITDNVGKIIFIAILTVGAFPLYLSHHTRPYGLIGSTSFAGATVIVLGIDCFSRAGLKEFWLYIWSLNDDLFPLHYHQKYPITRGIRVEIAAIIIICLAGVMSQLKVWKIVKQRREERASEQRRKEHERNLSDEEQGRKVEIENQQDQPLWEALHGGKNTRVQERFLDSGVGTEVPSTRKSSWGDVRTSDVEGMELQHMPGVPDALNDGGRVTVHVAQDDFYETSLVGGQRTSLERSMLDPTAKPSIHTASETSSTKGKIEGASRIIDPNLTLKPKVVPPPFKIPDLDIGSDDGHSSVEASAPSDHFPDRGSKRLSGASVMRKLSKRSRNSYHAASKSEEALMIPHVDEDRASSVAATHDGISDHGDPMETMDFSRSQTPVVENALDKESLEALAAVGQTKLSDKDTEAIQNPASVALPGSRPASVAFQDQGENRESHSPVSIASKDASERVPLSGNLPDGGSKVVTAYRTNEWAKHLDGADVPEIAEISGNKRGNVDKSQAIEPSAPLDVRALQETPLTAEPSPQAVGLATTRSRASKLMSRNPFSKNSKEQEPASKPRPNPNPNPLTTSPRPEANASRTSLAKDFSRTSSQTSLNSTLSQGDYHRPPLPQTRSSQSSIPNHRVYRSSSTPMGSTPLLESPIEEGIESSFPSKRFTPHDGHLMSERGRIINSKPSSTSLLRTSYSNVALDQHPAHRSLEEDNDDIPLAQRRSLLKRQSQTSSQPRRSSSGPGAPTRLSSGTSTPLTKSPYRSSSNPYGATARPAPTQRDSTISAWHQSLVPDTTAHLENQKMEARRADLLKEKQRESTSRLEGNIKKGVRASMVDQSMRREDMQSLHKQAMRRMQREAKI